MEIVVLMLCITLIIDAFLLERLRRRVDLLQEVLRKHIDVDRLELESQVVKSNGVIDCDEYDHTPQR